MQTLNVTTTVFQTKVKDDLGDTHILTIDYAKMHPTWLEAHLLKAAQRYANDTFSGKQGTGKLKAMKKLLDEIHSGEAMPEKARRSGGGGGGDPIKALALKNAKTALMAVFKKRTKLAKIADIIGAGDDAINKYFSADGTWDDAVVVAFIDTQRERGKRDYMQEAADLLADESNDGDDDI